MMTTDNALCIPESSITMFWVLGWWQLTRYISYLRGYLNTLFVVMRWWQITKPVSYLSGISSCSYRCHETMTNFRACFLPSRSKTMLWPLSWDDVNWRGMLHTWGVITILRPLSEDDVNCRIRWVSPCSCCCRETLTTDGACFIP